MTTAGHAMASSITAPHDDNATQETQAIILKPTPTTSAAASINGTAGPTHDPVTRTDASVPGVPPAPESSTAASNTNATSTAPVPATTEVPVSSALISSPHASTDILRMSLLPVSSLPPSASLNNSDSTISPSALAASLIGAGHTFATQTIQNEFAAKSSLKKSPPSSASVEVLSWQRPANSNGGTEAWFGRRSTHEDRALVGTASWQEFDEGLRANHSEHEGQYTPNVQETLKVCEWDNIQVSGYTDVDLRVYEMAHKMPAPLQMRFFPVVVATARAIDNQSLLVVQVPVDLAEAYGAKYSTGKVKSVVRGVYTSVEYVRKDDDGNIVWEMATASDAKGVLPMGVQKLGVPGAIVKDVGWFLDWVGNKRGQETA